MKKQVSKYIRRVVVVAAVAVFGIVSSAIPAVFATTGNALTVSPMVQNVILNPGESQKVSFRVSNPAEAMHDMAYELSVEPFYMSEQNELIYQAEGGMNDITDWISFDVPTEGKIEPNNVEEIVLTINVPESAPAGGQYFSVMVTEKNEEDNVDDSSSSTGDTRGTSIKETWRMAHLIYAEVTGDVTRQGEVIDASVSSFLLSGAIKGTSSVKNTGNVHGDAKYTLRVFPLFSDEEVYTNEENPATKTILPNRTVYEELAWDETPAIGIFNVVYTVEFEGAKAEVAKMVIVCPLWLLFLIIFAAVALVIWIAMKVKNGPKRRRSSED